MNTLYIEVIGSVVLAGVLGLFTGWMAQRAKSRRSMRRAVSYWQKRCEELTPEDGEDAESMRERMHSLDQLLGEQTARTRELETQLGAANSRLEKARGDAIRLNSQQAGIQERLQRMIREKDQELGELAQRQARDRTSGEVDGTRAPAARSVALDTPAPVANDEIEAYIDRLSDRGERANRPVQRGAAAATAPGANDAPPSLITARAPPAPSPPADVPTVVDEPPLALEPLAAATPPLVADAAAQAADESAVLSPVADAEGFDEDDMDDQLDDTLDATAVIDMEMEHDVTATRRIDPLDATSQEPLLYDEDTLAFDEETIAFDDATLAQVRERSHEA